MVDETKNIFISHIHEDDEGPPKAQEPPKRQWDDQSETIQ